MKNKEVCKKCKANTVMCQYCIYSKDGVEEENCENIINFNNNKYDGKSKKICPVCKKVYTEYPATSRKDNKTLICSDCGIKEIQEPLEEVLYRYNIIVD